MWNTAAGQVTRATLGRAAQARRHASNPDRGSYRMDVSQSGLFIVGRIDKMGRRIVFVNEPARPPFPGPWELHAVITV